MLRKFAWSASFLLLGGLLACRQDAIDQNVPVSIALSSPSFASGQGIPARFTCHGANVSPALAWEGLPSGTKSLALFMVDQDSLFGFVHWALFNLPLQPNSLPEGATLANGAQPGKNGKGEAEYTGPCPPGSSPHHYVFTLYALDDSLSVPAGAGRSEIVKAMQGHVLAEGKLTGSYQRP